MSASAGVTELDGRGLGAGELLAEADLAMYEAKETGRDRVATYSPDRLARMQARRTWVDRIRTALDTDAFALFAQPIVDVRTGTVVRHELLLRMCDPGGGHIAPDAFLPTADRFGLMPQIDRWVVRTAVAMLAEPGSLRHVAINISGRSLEDPEMERYIVGHLEAHGVAPGRLVLEITETAAIASVADARRFAARLNLLGCGLALDDFGTGFASFHYLKHMPFGSVKIAGDFVRGVEGRPEDGLLIESMVRVAHGMGLTTVAEWVESAKTLETLRRLGVDCAQGFHLGRPQPL